MEILNDIIQTTLNSFDFAYCIVVNVLTYLIINAITDARRREITTWYKRLILLCVILFTGVVYYLIGHDIKLLFNSAILAPVSWTWIFKPICKHFNIDYINIDDAKD